MNEQIISHERVKQDGEVFTPRDTVADMLNQPGIRLSLSRSGATFLEPSAGRGAFLVQILADKLRYVDRRYRSRPNRLRNYYKALKSVHGIELRSDNVRIARRRMLKVFLDASHGMADVHRAERIIKSNVRCGDALAEHKGPKYDVIIGNPPYAKKDTDANSSSSSPVFQEFVQNAVENRPNYVSFIISNSWFKGGKRSVTKMRDGMLKSRRIRSMQIYNDASQIFPHTHIRGGVSYFLWDKRSDNTGKPIKVTIHDENGWVSTYERKGPLGRNGLSVFIERQIDLDILHRVRSVSDTSLRSYVSNRCPFTIRPNFNTSRHFHVVSEHPESDYRCYGNRKNPVGYVSKAYMQERFAGKSDSDRFRPLVDAYEVIANRSNNIGIQGMKDDNIKAKCIRPGEICTETFVVIGSGLDLDADSVRNLCRYLRTKFARYMITLHKNRSDAPRSVYTFVPLQDFTDSGDIDWSKSENGIDTQLFRKYGLTERERERIERTIRRDRSAVDE